jgi:polyisoprenoid-binding protein YceI
MRIVKLVAAALVAVAVLLVGGTWLYLQVLRDDPPERLALTDATEDEGRAVEPVGIAGTWTVAEGSTVGYRVREVLFGQEAEGVGRTEDVTGTVVVEGSTVVRGEVRADMATVRSDEGRRDNQFRTRLMDVEQFPDATFRLLQPVDLGQEAEAGELVTAVVDGELTLRGTTRPVTLELDVRQLGDTFEVAGRLPIVFEEWGIPNPSNVAASVGDEGLLELLLVLRKDG